MNIIDLRRDFKTNCKIVDREDQDPRTTALPKYGVERALIIITTLPGTEVLSQKMKTFQETTFKKLQVSTVASIV